ncbi:intron Large complex component GCFC2-like [Rhipicephalus microplus]|uniref:intron Large complex component GCFC2-like n=1 Tax=Rhipicephalus microplus TaxID=6941 RepID=UPI003F6C53BB
MESAQRKAREAQHQGLAQPRNLVHHDGMFTYDEQPDADRLSFDKERELILDDARYVFEYVTEQLSSVAALKQKFARWKRDFGESYVQAYIPLCLVKLLVPFVRLQMVAWNPIEQGLFLDNFIAKVAAHVSRALDEHVYIPLYPRELVTLLVFFVVASHILLSLQGVGEQLMKNGLSWQGLLTEEPLKELSLCSLLNRYLIVALQAGLSQRLVSTLPTSWLRGSQLPQLQLLTRFLRLYLPHLEGVFGSSNLGPDMHARDPLEEVGELLASLTDKTK